MRCEPTVEACPGREKSGIATLLFPDCADQIDDRGGGQKEETENGDAGRKCNAACDGSELGDLLKQSGVGHGTSEIRGTGKYAWEARNNTPKLVSWMTSGLYKEYKWRTQIAYVYDVNSA